MNARYCLTGLILTFAICFGTVAGVDAVERTCGGDPVANTANVLCAAPSGPCTATQVTLGGNLEVTSGGCEFDLGGRALRVTRTFQMVGTGFFAVDNAGDITITSTGKLKARGDFRLSNGQIGQGGLIKLVSGGTLSIAGRIETTGDGAGAVELRATGPLRLESSGVIQANGISSTADEADRFANGGELSAVSVGDSIILAGLVYLNGQNHGSGGALHLQAAGSVEIDQAVEVTGGSGGGGDVDILAGDNVTVTRPIDVDSRSGGGEGGSIAIEAGTDELGGLVPGGSILIDNTRLELSGSPPDGDGGELDLTAPGTIQVLGANSLLRANAGTTSSGSGGDIAVRSGDADVGSVSASDGDVLVQGQVLAQGGGLGGTGGRLELVAGRALILDAPADLTSRVRGGFVTMSAGGNVDVQAPIDVHAMTAPGRGGSATITAGLASNGTLTLARDINAASGAGNGRRQAITLTACTLVVQDGVRIDGRGGTASNGALGGALIRLAAKDSLQLKGTSQYLANPGGDIAIVHPPATAPAVDVGTTFSPVRKEDTSSPVPFPKCGAQS